MLTNHRVCTALALTVLMMTSGCVLPWGGGATNGHSGAGHLSLYMTESVSDGPPYQPVGEVNFILDSSIVSDDTFENVFVCMYDKNGDLIASQDLGTFATPSTTANVSLETETVPYYVYVHHPRFAEIDSFDVELMMYQPDRHAYADGYPDALPFDYKQMVDTGCTPPE